MKRLLQAVAGGVAAAAWTVTLTPLVPAASAATDPGDAPVVVVLDVSDSMNEQTSSSQIRIDAARAAVLDLIGALSPGDQYGLVTYPGGRTVDGCSTGQQTTPLGPLDHKTALAQVRGLSPDGDTPTGPALLHAASAMESAGYSQGTIVLVSDGESNCGGDPCEIAKSLRSEGFEVTVNTVGFEISDQGSQQLGCIADATGGRHVDVTDGTDLSDAIAAGRGGLLDLQVQMPASIPVVTGTGTAGSPVTLTVTNAGSGTASDVRLSLSIGTGGRVQVVKPVRFLGNLAPGATRSVTYTARPDQTFEPDPLAWTAAATAGNSGPKVLTGTVQIDSVVTQDSLGPLLSGAERVVVMGDSYSSGEGSGNYTDSSSGDAANWCHRSPVAYGPVLFGDDDTTMIACSGAVSRDLTAQQKSHDQLMVPQLLKLRAEAVSVDSPDAVLMTLGGNDIGFSDIVKACLLNSNCQDLVRSDGGSKDNPLPTNGEYYVERARVVSADLIKAYEGVDAAVNDPQAVKRRGGKVAPVVVLPYVRVLPETSAGAQAPKGCFVGFNPDEVDFMNTLIDQLNESVKWSVSQMRAKGRPFYYVDEVVGAFQPNHTMCEKTSSFARYISVDRSWRMADIPLDKEAQQELVHPNWEGYEAIARAVAAWSRSVTPTTSGPAPKYVSKTQRGPGFWQSFNHTVWGADSPGEKIDVEVGGYAKGTTVTFTIKSRPQSLGTATADADGNARLETVLPTDLELGHHQLIASGLDPDGNLRFQKQDLTLHRPGYATALTVLVLGGVCLVVTTVLILLERRRRSRPLAPAS